MGEEENEIPDSGAVFTFGRSRFAENLPSHFFIRNDPVVDISCGEEHTLVVCQNGRVFGFGGNDFGQLGLGSTTAVTKPSCIKSLKPEKVKRIVCGKTHSLALTGGGKLYAWGNNGDCQLGIGSEGSSSTTPKQIELNDVDETIASITAGAQHTALLTDGGKVFIWGSNSCGQLGLSDGIKKCSKPTRLNVKEKVLQIACGYTHTIMLTEDKYLLVFGEGSSGKLGLGGTSSVPIPIPLKFDKNVSLISAGGNHSLALTDEGDVYAWGNNEHGQLGFSEEKTEITNPILVTPLLNVRVSQISCGESHSAFISDNGELYTCGESKYGKLCSDSELKSDIMGSRTLPFKVNRFKALKVQKVACGGCHTMVLAIPTNRQKQGTVNGIIEKTNKENELAKKAISETSIEGMSEISSTPRKTSRTSLPPLQKVVIPKIELDSTESLSTIPDKKSNGDEKMNGDGKQHEDEKPEENCENSQTSLTNDITTTEENEEKELMENGETVLNNGDELEDNKEEPAQKESSNTSDNVSRISPSNHLSYVRRVTIHRQKCPKAFMAEFESRKRKSNASSIEDGNFVNNIHKESSYVCSASLPCLNGGSAVGIEDERKFPKLDKGSVCDVPQQFTTSCELNTTCDTESNDEEMIEDNKTIGNKKMFKENNYGNQERERRSKILDPLKNNVGDLFSMSKEMYDLQEKFVEKNEDLPLTGEMYNLKETFVEKDGKLFSLPKNDMQCLLAFKLNQSPVNENAEDGYYQNCVCHSSENPDLKQSILYNSWTRCNQNKIENNWTKELESIKLERVLIGEDNDEQSIGEDDKLCEIMCEASMSVEKFCEENNHYVGNKSEREKISSPEGYSIGSVVLSKFKDKNVGNIKNNYEQNYDFVCFHGRQPDNQEGEYYNDYLSKTENFSKACSSEFEYVTSRNLRTSISCPHSPLKFEDLKENEQKKSCKSGSSSMTYISQTNNFRRKMFVENQYARSNFTIDSIKNVSDDEEEEFDLVMNRKSFENMKDCVVTEEKEAGLENETSSRASTVEDVSCKNSQNTFFEDSLDTESPTNSYTKIHQCRLCGSVFQEKFENKIDDVELETNINQQKRSSIFNNIRTNLKTMFQRTKSFTTNYYKYKMASNAKNEGIEKVYENEMYDERDAEHWMNDEIVEGSENNFEDRLEDFENSPVLKMDDNWGECCLKMIFKGNEVPVMVSEDTGSAADLSSTISVISPVSERKAKTTDSAKSQPEDEIKEDTKLQEEETAKSETPVSENKDEEKSENSKETESNGETKSKSSKQKEKNKGSKKPTSSVCVIL